MTEHPSHLYREILSQPEVLRTLLREEVARVRAVAQRLRRERIHYVVIAARGSSDNAALYGKYLFATTVGLPVALATPSVYTRYHRPPRLDRALVLGISQSGRSPDIVAVIEEARRQGVPTLAITNDPSSPLAQAATEVLLLRAGEERSIAATKTYTAQLMVLALLAIFLADNEALLPRLHDVPGAIEECIAQSDHIAAIAERYRYMTTCVVIGRGYNYATAFEWALKLKELTYVLAEPYSSADFQHGPIAIVANGFPVFIIAPAGKVHDEIHQTTQKLRAKGAELVVISDVAATLGLARVPILLPGSLPEWLTPFTATVIGQLFAHHLTLTKDFDPDHPRGLTKVTETR